MNTKPTKKRIKNNKGLLITIVVLLSLVIITNLVIIVENFMIFENDYTYHRMLCGNDFEDHFKENINKDLGIEKETEQTYYDNNYEYEWN